MMAIMYGTEYDPEKYHNAVGDGKVAVDTLIPPSSQYPGEIALFVRRGAPAFSVGQNVTYENGNILISGKIKDIEDKVGQSFLVYIIPYSDTDLQAAISGGTMYVSQGGSFSEAALGGSLDNIKGAINNALSGVNPTIKKYAPVAILGGLIVLALWWKFKKKK